MISSKPANLAASSPLDILSDFQQKHRLSVTKTAFLLGITENQYRKYFLQTKNKSKPSKAVINLCVTLDYILSEGLKLPEFPDIE